MGCSFPFFNRSLLRRRPPPSFTLLRTRPANYNEMRQVTADGISTPGHVPFPYPFDPGEPTQCAEVQDLNISVSLEDLKDAFRRYEGFADAHLIIHQHRVTGQVIQAGQVAFTSTELCQRAVGLAHGSFINGQRCTLSHVPLWSTIWANSQLLPEAIHDLTPAANMDDGAVLSPAHKKRKTDGPIKPAPSCSICGDELNNTYSKPCLKCDNLWCSECLKRWFLRATCDHERMPAHCCMQALHPGVAGGILSSSDLEHYKRKYEEHSTSDPLYCPIPTCSTFIPPRLLDPKKDTVNCRICLTTICIECKQISQENNHTCATLDPEVEKIISLKYKTCPKCGTGVQKMFGCPHLRCQCGAHWCWECKRPINTCYSDPCIALLELEAGLEYDPLPEEWEAARGNRNNDAAVIADATAPVAAVENPPEPASAPPPPQQQQQQQARGAETTPNMLARPVSALRTMIDQIMAGTTIRRLWQSGPREVLTSQISEQPMTQEEILGPDGPIQQMIASIREDSDTSAVEEPPVPSIASRTEATPAIEEGSIQQTSEIDDLSAHMWMGLAAPSILSDTDSEPRRFQGPDPQILDEYGMPVLEPVEQLGPSLGIGIRYPSDEFDALVALNTNRTPVNPDNSVQHDESEMEEISAFEQNLPAIPLRHPNNHLGSPRPANGNLDDPNARDWELDNYDFGGEPMDEDYDVWGCSCHFTRLLRSSVDSHWIQDDKYLDCMRCFELISLHDDRTREKLKGLVGSGKNNKVRLAWDCRNCGVVYCGKCKREKEGGRVKET